MRYIIERNTNSLNVALLCVLYIFSVGCSSEKISPTIGSFSIYDTPLHAVEEIANGYLLLSDSSWYAIDKNGNPSLEVKVPIDYNLYSFQLSDILKIGEKIYVLSSLYNVDGSFIDLGIFVFGANGNFIDVKTIRIIENFRKGDLQKINANYKLREPLYALGQVLPNDELLIAFNYIGKPRETWQYALIHVNDGLDIINRKDYVNNDFYSWIHELAQVSDNKFVLTRGGNDWYAIDQFDLSLERNTDFKRTNDLGDPMLTNVMALNNEQIVLTGHADLRNNGDNSFVTNFDFWVLYYNLNSKEEEASFLYGERQNKELSFDSFVTKDNSLLLAGGMRGTNQTTFDLSANIKFVETDFEGNQISESIITNFGGMEAMFVSDNSNKTINIIGRKFGYNEDLQTFLRVIKH